MSAAEAFAAALTAVAAATIVFTYLCDLAGVPFAPVIVAPFSVAAAAATTWYLRRHVLAASCGAGTLMSAVVVIGGLFVWLLYLAAPSGLPIGGGDLTHHLQLIDYLERHWRLVHSPATVEPYLGEMVHYTPGVHVLAALIGRWTGRDGVHAVHAVVAGSIAIKAGFVVFITQRVLAAHPLRVPLALASAAALLLPYPYVLDAFLRDSFLAQVVSEWFAVAMWWALVVWDDTRPADVSRIDRSRVDASGVDRSGADRSHDDAGRDEAGRRDAGYEETTATSPPAWPLACFGVFACGAFLTWPIWIGPPCVALALLLLVRRRLPIGVRVRHGALALVPLGTVAALYLAGRTAQLGMSGAAGAVMHPSVQAYSVALLVLSSVGLALGLAAVANPRVDAPRLRATMFLIAGIALQATALYVQAMAIGNESAYMAFKTLYLTPYPMAVLAVLPLARLADDTRRRAAADAGDRRDPTILQPRGRLRRLAGRPQLVVWLIVALLSGQALVRLRVVRRPPPALTNAMLEAGVWAREHLPRGCVAYMVPDDDTSYWLHLAVLRNPRMSERSADLATFSMGQTIVRWFSAGDGLPYAIADFGALTRDVREDLDVIARFDSAAVVRRRTPSTCADEHLPPAP